MSKRKDDLRWSNYGLRILINTVSHPFEYAKVLIQIGYEPIPPRPGKTFFGKPALKLPNIFEYVKYIKSVDGFVGCYNGLAPKVCGNIMSAIATQKLLDYLEPPSEEEEFGEEPTEDEKRKIFVKGVKNEIIIHTAAIVVSQPFHVITVRMMAQFIGRESKYMGILSSLREVYRENGLVGFFSGLVPRLVGDIISLLLVSSLTYAINNYVIEEKELGIYTGSIMSVSFDFLATSVTYPFQVISNCMAVTNSGLVAGSPTYMPHYKSWIDCWVDLSNRNQLKRGSSILVRYYTGPSIVIGGQAVPFPSKDKQLIS
uniref:Mitochondrial carrier homolog 2-like isoform X1 n=1 Tax=Diabrotica virgifera virgifera TaxID=50390 RepID=A0A6P7H1S6_DIAVI